MKIEATNFYHSFPRVRPNDTKDYLVQSGLDILTAIRRIGLVLAPENVVWKHPTMDGGLREVTVRQRRICFTELAQNQVEEHGTKFGPFSLEFQTDILRGLGALPVIYVPQGLTHDQRFSTLGPTVVATLGDIKYTIDRLHDLFRLTDPNYIISLAQNPAQSVAEDCIVNLGNIDGTGELVASYSVPLKSIKDILNYLEYRNAPFDQMSGVLSLLESLYYPTDDEHHDIHLAYYRQREWRLVQGPISDGKPQSRLLTDSEKAILLNINEKFWGGTIPDGKSLLRRVDDAYVIDHFEDISILELISAVIVPVEAYEQARELFGDKVRQP